ncbi:hypothetical protein DV736_g525, partial [Chaetothyriales sp. CBS 134916]
MEQTQSDGRVPLWLDCDPGHDDACAILLAAYHPCLDLLGISTVHGNASLANTTKNTLSILEAIGKPNIRVFPGASKPFCRTASAAPDIHGESGLDGTDLLPNPPKRTAVSHVNAIKEMRDALIRCPPNTAWLVTTGTLTNASLLFAVYPEVSAHIKGLSIMGGAIGNGFSSATMGPAFMDSLGNVHARIGNKTPWAEFNIWCDPEAAESLFSHPVLAPKTWLIPLDVTHQARAGKPVQDLLLWGGSMTHGGEGRKNGNPPTRLRRMFHQLLVFFSQTYAERFGLVDGPPLHDPLAVAVLLHDHPSSNLRIAFDHLVGEQWNVRVGLEGEQIGRTVVTSCSDKAGLCIPRSLDLEAFWSSLEMCMAKADEATGLAT